MLGLDITLQRLCKSLSLDYEPIRTESGHKSGATPARTQLYSNVDRICSDVRRCLSHFMFLCIRECYNGWPLVMCIERHTQSVIQYYSTIQYVLL